jgi:hypothetical protein
MLIGTATVGKGTGPTDAPATHTLTATSWDEIYLAPTL